jgi:hypothetical protein
MSLVAHDTNSVYNIRESHIQILLDTGGDNRVREDRPRRHVGRPGEPPPFEPIGGEFNSLRSIRRRNYCRNVLLTVESLSPILTLLRSSLCCVAC